MRIHSVSQILLYHEMSQHISYKRDYPSLKVKEGGREPLKGDRETEGGEGYTQRACGNVYVNTCWCIQVSVGWILTSACSVTCNCICKSMLTIFPKLPLFSLFVPFVLSPLLFCATSNENLYILIWLMHMDYVHTHILSMAGKLS